jgi:helicase
VLRETYGVKEELLPLVELRGVGRVRGRALFSRGYKTLRDLQKAEAGDIARIPSIGPAVARKIKEQLGAGEEAVKGPLIGQSGLTDFN